jgi:hypothetical protein
VLQPVGFGRLLGPLRKRGSAQRVSAEVNLIKQHLERYARLHLPESCQLPGRLRDRKFGITSYKLLPTHRFEEAMKFLTEQYTTLTGEAPF